MALAKEEMKKGMTCECGNCMGPVCGTISGIIVAVGGLALIAAAMGTVLTDMQGEIVCGVALVLFGLSVLIHALGMCPMCNGK